MEEIERGENSGKKNERERERRENEGERRKKSSAALSRDLSASWWPTGPYRPPRDRQVAYRPPRGRQVAYRPPRDL